MRGYHSRRGQPGRHKIVSREGSYHGATGGVHWLGTSTPGLREGYEMELDRAAVRPAAQSVQVCPGGRDAVGVRDCCAPTPSRR